MARTRKKMSFKGAQGYIKAFVYSIALTVFMILIFTVLLKSFSSLEIIIPYFNQILKILGIIVCVYVCNKYNSKLAPALICGIGYITITYLLFSLINLSFGSISVLISDLIMAGIISAIVSVILKRIK